MVETHRIRLSYFIREEITAGHFTTSHVSTHEQPADIFTKALGQHQFRFLMGKLGVCNLHSNLKGSYN